MLEILVVFASLLLGTLSGMALAVRILGGSIWPAFVFLGAFLPLLTYPGLQAVILAVFGLGFVVALHVVVLICRDSGNWRRDDDDDDSPPDYPWWPGFEHDLERYRQSRPATRAGALR